MMKEAPYILACADLDRDALPLAGGKAANLGELIRAGLPVPPGFCITTAAYTLAAEQAGLASVLEALATSRGSGEKLPLTALAKQASGRLLSVPLSPKVAREIVKALCWLLGASVPKKSANDGSTILFLNTVCISR
jgi:phosphoenolpyruvate synthase/pyruvate phosphate dikinase